MAERQQSRSRRSRTFRVLLVCTGNICRSPLAEQLVDVVLSDRPNQLREAVRVSSAGTRATPGMPMDEYSANVSRLRGGTPEVHASQRVRADQLAAADLVLTMDLDQRRDVVTAAPAAAPHTFLLLEFAELVADALTHHGTQPAHRAWAGEDDVAARLRAVVRAAARRRGIAELPEDVEIADPRGGTDREHRRVGARIAAAVDTIAATTTELARRQDGRDPRSVVDGGASGAAVGRESGTR